MRWLILPLAVGLLAGSAAKAADLTYVVVYARSWVGWPNDVALGVFGLGSALGPFVALTLIVARRQRSQRLGAAASGLLLLASLGPYYALHLVYEGSPDVMVICFWALAAVTAGPVLGAFAWCAHRRDRWGITAIALCMGLVLGEAVSAGVIAIETPAYAVTAVFDVLVALVVLGRIAPDNRRRIRALLLTPVFTALGAAALMGPYRLAGLLTDVYRDL